MSTSSPETILKLMQAGVVNLHAKSFSIGAGRNAGVALEETAEEDDVLIAHGVADFLHGFVIAFQHALGGGDAEFLEVVQWAVAGGFLEATNEIAQAYS